MPGNARCRRACVWPAVLLFRTAHIPRLGRSRAGSNSARKRPCRRWAPPGHSARMVCVVVGSTRCIPAVRRRALPPARPPFRTPRRRPAFGVQARARISRTPACVRRCRRSGYPRRSTGCSRRPYRNRDGGGRYRREAVRFRGACKRRGYCVVCILRTRPLARTICGSICHRPPVRQASGALRPERWIRTSRKLLSAVRRRCTCRRFPGCKASEAACTPGTRAGSRSFVSAWLARSPRLHGYTPLSRRGPVRVQGDGCPYYPPPPCPATGDAT
jgi:hypothetical protein